MARSQAVALQEGLSPEETAQMDEMRQADNAPQPEETVEQTQPEETAVEQTEEERTHAGMVPRSRLNEESERRRQSETRLAEIERQNTLLQERTNLILQSVQAQQQQRQPVQEVQEPPALDKDPVGYLVGTLQRQGDVIQQLLQQEQYRSQQTQQLSGQLTLQQRAVALENEYRGQNPEYDSALKYVLDGEHRDLNEAGIKDVEVRNQIISEKYLTIARLAINEQRRNPGEVIFNIAQGRGFKPNGVVAQEVIPPAPTAAERVANVAAGQQQSRSLSSVRGAAPVPLTAQRLLEMSNEDFAKAIATPDGRALLG